MYQQANYDRPCCVSNSKIHRRCNCDGIINQDDCQDLCSVDSGCIGYVIRNEQTCQLATNSSCPSNCKGPVNVANIGQLGPQATCGSEGNWNGGCMIKSGAIQYKIVISERIMSYSILVIL